MAIGKNKLGDQVVPKSEQQKHQHSKDEKKASSVSKNDKPVKEESKQSLGYQDSGSSRAQQTPD